MISNIPPSQAAAILQSQPEAVLLDVRHPESFAAGHLPGARSNCVFDVAFSARLAGMSASLECPLIVYGESEVSHEAAVAAEKAMAAGYRDVRVIDGGRAAWAAAGLPVVGGPPLASAIPSDGRWIVDTSESRIEWTGRNLINKHWGTMALAAGELILRDGLVSEGKFTIEMESIRCADLADSPLHDVLIDHLKDDDFFAVGRYPSATLEIHGSRWLEGAAPGAEGLELDGELDLRGVTRPITLRAAAGLTPDGRLAAQALVTIDRTEWGVLYGSGKFFQFLAGHLVNDQIELQVRVLAQRE